MTIPLFDALACIGRRLAPRPNDHTTVRALLKEMKRCQIERALVSHYSCWESDINMGNGHLIRELAGCRTLVPASAVVPDTGGDTPPVKTCIRQLMRNGFKAVWLFPKRMSWSLAEWCADGLLRELEKQRMPALISWNETTPDELHEMLENHPGLPLLVYDLNYRLNRIFFPLLKRHKNLRLIASPPYAAHQGLELLCGQGLAQQVLFGTGYPEADPAAAVTYLMYAKISDKEKRLIGSGNLEKLVNGVRHA
jgi:hypothetical protein